MPETDLPETACPSECAKIFAHELSAIIYSVVLDPKFKASAPLDGEFIVFPTELNYYTSCGNDGWDLDEMNRHWDANYQVEINVVIPDISEEGYEELMHRIHLLLYGLNATPEYEPEFEQYTTIEKSHDKYGRMRKIEREHNSLYLRGQITFKPIFSESEEEVEIPSSETIIDRAQQFRREVNEYIESLHFSFEGSSLINNEDSMAVVFPDIVGKPITAKVLISFIKDMELGEDFSPEGRLIGANKIRQHLSGLIRKYRGELIQIEEDDYHISEIVTF